MHGRAIQFHAGKHGRSVFVSRAFLRHSPAPFAVVSLLLAASSALASEAAEWPRPDEYVVVTASREAEPIVDVLVPVTVIDRDDIDRSLAIDVGQLLGQQPGIDITPYGGPGQTVSVFMRGTNSNHTIFLVDGIRINPGTLGVAAIQNIAPDLVDHVEIVKGPRSSIWGTDAIGGVVNIVTRTPTATGGTALLGFGRYNTREAFGDWDVKGESGSLSFATRWLESDGFPVLASDSTKAGYRNLSESLTARTSVGGVDLVAHAWNATGNTQYSDFGTPTDENFKNSIAALEASGHVSSDWKMLLRVGYMRDDLLQTALDPYVTPPTPDYETTHRTTVDWQNSISAGRHAITTGALSTDEKTRALVYGTSFDVATRSTTGYIEDRFAVGAHHFAVALGRTHHSTFGDHGTYNAEYGFESSPGTMWTAGIGTAFRAPDSTDRFGYGANPALRPETSRNVEVGVRRRISARQEISVTAYDNHIDNLIVFVYTAADPNGINSNLGRTRIRGAEANWQYTTEAWRARLGVAHQEPVSADPGTMLIRRSRWDASGSIERMIGSHELGLDARTVGTRPDTIYDANYNPLQVSLGGYTLVAATWRYSLGHGLTLQAKVDNLLDKRYEYISGYNTMRRSVFGAVRYDFR
jgi:vitamin B12 transporter